MLGFGQEASFTGIRTSQQEDELAATIGEDNISDHGGISVDIFENGFSGEAIFVNPFTRILPVVAPNGSRVILRTQQRTQQPRPFQLSHPFQLSQSLPNNKLCKPLPYKLFSNQLRQPC